MMLTAPLCAALPLCPVPGKLAPSDGDSLSAASMRHALLSPKPFRVAAAYRRVEAADGELPSTATVRDRWLMWQQTHGEELQRDALSQLYLSVACGAAHARQSGQVYSGALSAAASVVTTLAVGRVCPRYFALKTYGDPENAAMQMQALVNIEVPPLQMDVRAACPKRPAMCSYS